MLSEHQITTIQAGQRLDIFCTSKFQGISRGAIQKAIKSGSITVNKATVKPKYSVKDGDIISIDMSTEQSIQPDINQELPNIEILFEDSDIVVINKPAGLLVHATPVSNEPTVVDWLLKHSPESKGVGEDPARSGIVHRLDRDTSGAIVLAKNQEAFEKLKIQFKKHYVKKEYLALVFGKPKESVGRINKPLMRSKSNPSRRTVITETSNKNNESTLRGKPAITEWKVEEPYNDKFALLRVFPFTGRTHQIRVHLHHIGHPVVGDALYNMKRQKAPVGVQRQLLHDAQITLKTPTGSRKIIKAPLPHDFENVINQLQNK